MTTSARPGSSEFGAQTAPLFSPDEPDPADVEGSLEGQLVVVSGATGPLGVAMATELIRRGAELCLLGRDAVELDDVIAGLGEQARALLLRCDIGSSDDVHAAVDFVERLDRRVDLVVHAAGLAQRADVSTGPVEDLDEHYLVNVRGPYLLTQRLVPLLADHGARIVTFAPPEQVPRDGDAADAHRAIAFAGLRALTAELRAELAPRGVAVLNVVADDPPWRPLTAEGQAAFLASLAAAVVDALARDEVEVTELVARGVSTTVRVERR